ncbi:hypothetical protein [Flagellimonas onchidii]|uniref:hypothetical protein n=1 Tax=Flagellimonas onchidii TaxID=2562684 RepID=UPI0010A5FC0C|nr:hypothetical protein [Allomuricauda onchidii]
MNKIIRTIISVVGRKFVDIMALVVAFIAVLISINQSKTQKEIERINKQPLLQITFIKVDSETKKGFKLTNLGFGPAIIKSYRYYLNMEDYKNGTNEKSKWIPALESKLEFIFEDINNLNENYVVGEKDSDKDVFLLGTTAKYTTSESIKPMMFFNSNTSKVMDNIVIEIEYTSMNPLDEYYYYLRYSENQFPNNYRKTSKISNKNTL